MPVAENAASGRKERGRAHRGGCRALRPVAPGCRPAVALCSCRCISHLMVRSTPGIGTPGAWQPRTSPQAFLPPFVPCPPTVPAEGNAVALLLLTPENSQRARTTTLFSSSQSPAGGLVLAPVVRATRESPPKAP